MIIFYCYHFSSIVLIHPKYIQSYQYDRESEQIRALNIIILDP